MLNQMICRMKITVMCCVAAAGFTSAARGDVKAAAEFSRTLKPFLAKYCVSCHGTTRQESRLRFDRIEKFQTKDRHLWTMVHEKLAAGEMPPRDQPQPEKQARRDMLDLIRNYQRSSRTTNVRQLRTPKTGRRILPDLPGPIGP